MKRTLVALSFVVSAITVTAQCNVSAAFNLSSQTACTIPHTVNFTNLSSGYDTLWWDFGTGVTSNTTNPTYTYQSTGDFTVTLIATDTVADCSDTTTATISIYIPGATVVANPTSGCAPLEVEFNSSSFSPGTFSWDFGDGSPADSQQNTFHVYTTPGNYSVTIIHTAPNGCTQTTTMTNYIQVLGTEVDFISDYTSIACSSPATVSFTDNSVTNATITDWTWTFGDGYVVSVQHPLHNYSGKGAYDVSLTVTDSDGCTASKVYAALIELDSTYTFVDTSYICRYSDFTFLDGTTFTGITTDTVHTSVFATLVGQCDSSYTSYIKIIQPDTSTSVNGFNLTANASGAIYEWLDCDNNFSPLANGDHQNYIAVNNGSYAVSVTQNGCTDTSACITIAGVNIYDLTGTDLVVYPNPTNGKFFVQLPASEHAVQVYIRDLSGRLTAQYDSPTSGINVFEISENPGSYFVDVYREGQLLGRTMVLKL